MPSSDSGFCPGYVKQPFKQLVMDAPGPEAFPAHQFRVEWGPVFHRGRLDGSARVLVIGQDPAAHEAVARRILVGEAGQRVQGALAKLGITKSYVMINVWAYSVYGDGTHPLVKKKAIADYRNAWLDALLLGNSKVEAVVALGRFAKPAFEQWAALHPERAAELKVVNVSHPTARDEAVLLKNWNAGFGALAPQLQFRDNKAATWSDYGATWADADLAPIPAADLPPGLPAWMRSVDTWARRAEVDGDAKRANIVVTVPPSARPF